ncbi:MAG: nuclear transport factor 2 family protein [Sphingomonadaceae bacterium]
MEDWNLQRLVDRQEITDLIYLYCRGLDRADEATLRRIYHEDAIEDRGPGLFVGNAHEWIGWTMKVLPAFVVTQHCVLNILLDIDGDTAFGESYFQAYHRFAGGPGTERTEIKWPEAGTEMILAGRYLDRFERRDNVWKIAHRRMVNDWCRTQPVADAWFDENPTAYRAVKDISDASLRGEIEPGRAN